MKTFKEWLKEKDNYDKVCSSGTLEAVEFAYNGALQEVVDWYGPDSCDMADLVYDIKKEINSGN